MKNLSILTILFLLFTCHISAQVFTQVPGITTKNNFTAIDENANIAVVGGYHYYKSIDQGLNWTQMNASSSSALTNLEGFNIAITDQNNMCVVGKSFDYNTCSVAKTTDGGFSWFTTLSIPASANSTTLTDIAGNGNTMIVTAVNGIYRSTDNGNNWTFIPISSNGQAGKFVRFNSASNTWLIGGYGLNFHVSNDNGLTWNETSFSISSPNVLDATAYANGILLSTSTSNTNVVRIDANNVEQSVANFPNSLVVNANPCKTTGFLPNNKLLTHNNQLFYMVDTLTSNVYYLTNPPNSSYEPTHFTLGSTFGIASANTLVGQGKVFRIDLTQAATTQIHPYFQIAGPGPCAGENIVATATANYADSVRWFVNNVYINTGTTMIYPTPAGIYTTYAVKMTQYYNGIAQSTLKNVVMTAPSAPKTFSYIVDTTACYGEPLLVAIDPNGPNVPNSMMKITYNGQLVYGPVPIAFANINAYTTPITTDGVLKIITFKSDYCDPSTDTVEMNITVGPNLFDFEVLPHDSVICVGVNPYLYINGTDSDYFYDFHTTYSYMPDESVHSVVQGNSTGTMEAYQTGTGSYLNDNSQPETYGPLYMYVHLEITDDAGCSPARVIDTIRVQRSTAFYELHSRSFLQGDTVHLSNAFVTPNRLWSSEELNSSYIMNETDTIPLIIADTTGFFGIKLRNEPVLGCVDSMTNFIHYATQAPDMDTACSMIKLHRNDFPHRVRMDQFGNLYEIRVTDLDAYHPPLYVFSKYDPFGNLIWQRKANQTGWAYGDITGIVIEEVEFDDQGNPVIAMWIAGEDSYEDSLIDFPGAWPNEISANYVMKLDKNNGDVIWRTNFNDILNFNAVARVTDVAVDGNKIYATMFQYNVITFFTLDGNNGAHLHNDFINIGWSNSSYIPESYHLPIESSEGGRHSYWSPQIDVLSTGEVIAVGNYQQTLFQDVALGGTFAMKYHPDLGIYDVDTIAINARNTTGLPTMFVDKNDNITIAGNWSHNVFYMPIPPLTQILDSVIAMPYGTFVLNMDKNYNMNWLSLGTNSHVQDISYSRANNETYLVTYTKDNFSIGNNYTHMRAGVELEFDTTYTYLPVYWTPPLENYSNTHFVTHLDETGKPLEMKVLRQFDSVNYAFPDMKLASSACGDLAIFWGNAGLWPDFSGPSYQGDSLFLLLQYDNCTNQLCSYIEVPDTLQCFSGSTIEIQLSDYFNLDSFTYNIVQNNNVVVSNQTASVLNGHCSIPVSSIAPPFQLVITSPNSDTLFVEAFIQVQFGSIVEDTMCLNNGSVVLSGGSPIGGNYTGNGVTGNWFNPLIAGLGNHILSYNINQFGCEASALKEVFVDECLGINDQEININVYPSPFDDALFISTNGFINGQLSLLDQMGRILYQSVLNSNNDHVKVDTKQLSSGNYLVVIEGEDEKVYRYKLVKL